MSGADRDARSDAAPQQVGDGDTHDEQQDEKAENDGLLAASCVRQIDLAGRNCPKH